MSDAELLNVKVRIVADDLAEKRIKAKYVGRIVTIVGWKPNRNRSNGKIPIFRDEEGKEFFDKNLWWEKLV